MQSVHRRNQCHAPEGPSIVEYRCWMQVRAAASATGRARMMHYPGRNDSVPEHPGDFQGRSAGDRGVGEASGLSANETVSGFCRRVRIYSMIEERRAANCSHAARHMSMMVKGC